MNRTKGAMNLAKWLCGWCKSQNDWIEQENAKRLQYDILNVFFIVACFSWIFSFSRTQENFVCLSFRPNYNSSHSIRLTVQNLRKISTMMMSYIWSIFYVPQTQLWWVISGVFCMYPKRKFAWFTYRRSRAQLSNRPRPVFRQVVVFRWREASVLFTQH